MRLPCFADPENLEGTEEPKGQLISRDVPIPELAEMVVRGEVTLPPHQLRLLIEMLPFYKAKLSATAIATIDGRTFADALERCIERSSSPPPLLNGPKTIEHLVPVSEMKKPFATYRRS